MGNCPCQEAPQIQDQTIIYGNEAQIQIQKYKTIKKDQEPRIAIKMSALFQKYAQDQSIWKKIRQLLSKVKQNEKQKNKAMSVGRARILCNQLPQPYYVESIRAFYIGQWAYSTQIQPNSNVPQGIGRLYTQQWIYEGQIKTIPDGQNPVKFEIVLHGKGRKLNKHYQYTGTFQNGKLQGKGGTLKIGYDYQYVGQFKQDQKHGKGIEITKEFRYQGNFQKDNKTGRGILNYFLDSQRQSIIKYAVKIAEKKMADKAQHQKLLQSINKKIEVIKKQDEYLKEKLQYFKWPHPFPSNHQSVFHKIDFMVEHYYKTHFQEKYEGQMFNNELHGQGNYTWHDGKVYNGQFKFDKMHGLGEFYWPDGQIYRGMYQNDLKHGKGQMIWTQTKRWRGQWAFGLRHGYGESIVIKKNCILIKGAQWQKNKPVRKIFIRKIDAPECQELFYIQQENSRNPQEKKDSDDDQQQDHIKCQEERNIMDLGNPMI